MGTGAPKTRMLPLRSLLSARTHAHVRAHGHSHACSRSLMPILMLMLMFLCHCSDLPTSRRLCGQGRVRHPQPPLTPSASPAKGSLQQLLWLDLCPHSPLNPIRARLPSSTQLKGWSRPPPAPKERERKSPPFTSLACNARASPFLPASTHHPLFCSPLPRPHPLSFFFLQSGK